MDIDVAKYLDAQIVNSDERIWRELSEREQYRYKRTAKFYFHVGIIFGASLAALAGYGLVIFGHVCN